MLSPPPSSLPARPPTPTDFTIFPDAPKNRAPAEVLDPHNSTKLEPRQPRTLLVEALTGRKRAKPPHEQNHDQYLLKTQLGRDFALRTSAGVEFKIHVTKILGRSKTLQEYIFPGQVPNPSPPSFIDLSPSFLPIVVDRVVSFLYTGTYAAKLATRNGSVLHHAAHIPGSLTAKSYNHPEIDQVIFAIYMLSAAEDLEYLSLYDYAYDRLIDLLIRMRCTPDVLKNVIDAAFSPLGSKMRVGKDKDGWVQNLVVVGVIVQDIKYFQSDDRDLLRAMLSAEQYACFWAKHAEVKAANADITPKPKSAKPLPTTKAAKNRKSPGQRMEGRVQKSGSGKKSSKEIKEEERGTLAMLHGLKNLGLD